MIRQEKDLRQNEEERTRGEGTGTYTREEQRLARGEASPLRAS